MPAARPATIDTPPAAISAAVPVWPHRLALLLTGITFLLISVGGLVTTYDAGMAVPDWPGTYGYNLFLYPWQTWLFGPWDLFVEHGHRLLGALAGLVTIGVVLAVYRWDYRPWVGWLSIVALAAVIVQGALGGARVLLDERQLAMVHGCVGPAFFGLCIALCAVTSCWWQRGAPVRAAGAAGGQRLVLGFVALAYVQLVLGALVRHVPESASTTYFSVVAWAHLIGAGLLVILVVVLTWRLLRGSAAHPSCRWPTLALCGLLGLQVVLGGATWLVNFLWPTFLVQTPLVASYTLIEARGVLQSSIVTAHAANGSLILGTSVLLAMRSWRLIRSGPAEDAPDTRRKEGVADE